MKTTITDLLINHLKKSGEDLESSKKLLALKMGIPFSKFQFKVQQNYWTLEELRYLGEMGIKF